MDSNLATAVRFNRWLLCHERAAAAVSCAVCAALLGIGFLAADVGFCVMLGIALHAYLTSLFAAVAVVPMLAGGATPAAWYVEMLCYVKFLVYSALTNAIVWTGVGFTSFSVSLAPLPMVFVIDVLIPPLIFGPLDIDGRPKPCLLARRSFARWNGFVDPSTAAVITLAVLAILRTEESPARAAVGIRHTLSIFLTLRVFWACLIAPANAKVSAQPTPV